VFHDAVAAYSVYELPAQFEVEALAAATSGSRTTGLFLLGERHKEAETPRAIYTLMRRLDFRRLALEWEADLRPLIDAYLEGRADASAALSEDGRVTVGHFALLARLQDEGRLEHLVLLDETSRNWRGHWTERDAGMAQTLLRERNPAVPTLLVAGGFHTAPPARGAFVGHRWSRCAAGTSRFPQTPSTGPRCASRSSDDRCAMGREGFEPSTLGLRVPCSTS
jgi:hypothetical protein